jgi:hypothetical protein
MALGTVREAEKVVGGHVKQITQRLEFLKGDRR